MGLLPPDESSTHADASARLSRVKHALSRPVEADALRGLLASSALTRAVTIATCLVLGLVAFYAFWNLNAHQPVTVENAYQIWAVLMLCVAAVAVAAAFLWLAIFSRSKASPQS